MKTSCNVCNTYGMLFSFLLIWGSVFSTLAGLVAFLINYMEMSRHYAEKRKPLIQALPNRCAHVFIFYVHNVSAGLWPPLSVLNIHREHF